MNEKQARVRALPSSTLKSTASTASTTTPSNAPLSAQAQLGTITAISSDGSIMVSVAGAAKPSVARLAVAIEAAQLQQALDSHQAVVLVFENGALNKPIIVGFITTPTFMATDSAHDGPLIEADVDGKRVRLTAKDEVVLECGAASITLRRNGRIVIRGTHVESHSDGTNRIKGGQVRIN